MKCRVYCFQMRLVKGVVPLVKIRADEMRWTFFGGGFVLLRNGEQVSQSRAKVAACWIEDAEAQEA